MDIIFKLQFRPQLLLPYWAIVILWYCVILQERIELSWWIEAKQGTVQKIDPRVIASSQFNADDDGGFSGACTRDEN